MKKMLWTFTFGLIGIVATLLPVMLAAEPKVLEATITESDYLPPELYGEWAVTATLQESNPPGFSLPVVNSFWILEQSKETVTLSNPVTQASAAIRVEAVNGNTASFHRSVTDGKRQRVSEYVTVTVHGDTFLGTTEAQVEIFKNEAVVQRYFARYQLSAHRIGGARVKFGVSAPSQAIDFEIEPVVKAP